MHKTVTGEYRGDKLAFKIAQPVQELLNEPGGAGTPSQEWRDEAAETYACGEHFADFYPGQETIREMKLRNRMNYGIIRLPECAPIGMYQFHGEMHYVIGHVGYSRFDQAVLHAMAIHQGMNVNSVGRFVDFVRAIVRDAGSLTPDEPAEPLL